jgi:plasmid stabilization system protein ParE
MTIRFARRALIEAEKIGAWWREHRPAASDLFEAELAAALAQIATAPTSGAPYSATNLDAPVRRILLRKTAVHVYYADVGQSVVIVSLWGARRRRGPKL